ncbi:hypothetical protein HPP92_026872 [Vanilla planifolia]|uniref:Uncharacterized protein n=1 Tax=Vanilla planifolia TaxID=51239 RepID=A0A835U5N3_VANPL|nr:hypothetical protein HPP92_026872 [Vanilla planifolia]
MSHGLLPSFGRPSSTLGQNYVPGLRSTPNSPKLAVLLPTELRCPPLTTAKNPMARSPNLGPHPQPLQGRFPDFEYDATGGSGTATGKADGPTDELTTRFETESSHIPPLTRRDHEVPRLPLPPYWRLPLLRRCLKNHQYKEWKNHWTKTLS